MFTLNEEDKTFFDGHKLPVFIRHCRKSDFREFTLALLEKGEESYNVGIAVLNTQDKNYIKDFGRKIAIGRAMKHPIAYIESNKVKKLGVQTILNAIEFFFSKKKNLRSAMVLLGQNGNGNTVREVVELRHLDYELL